MEGKDEILQSISEFKTVVMQKFSDGEKRFDKQDMVINDIIDQIKGNEDKDIKGLRPMLKEHNKILFIPILVSKIPKPYLIGVIIIMLEGLLEMAHAGLITTLINLFTK